MSTSPISSPHLHRSGGNSRVSRVMLQVALALLPAFAVSFWHFGWGVLFNLLIATAAALGSEAVVLWLRRRPITPALADGSALVTAMLLAIALPPLAPWWLPLVGAAFAIIFAKQLYGGLGFNPFNPAMIGYVVLLISFPREMTAWLAPTDLREATLGLGETAGYIFGGYAGSAPILDTLSGATPLDAVKTQLALGRGIDQILAEPLFGLLGGKGWEWVNVTLLLGGLWLLYRRIISWQVPVALLSALALMAGLFHLIDAARYSTPLFHLFSGGAMLGAFFIATDPVSGATSARGRLIFGAGVGIIAYTIRSWGGYPDGIAFGVLLMNMAAPTIDYYTQPRVFGAKDK